ncbi:MAG: MazG family protein [Oscillospiraceae bacterium]|jgi:tetrapyrrole methylase family protein/MazG family protein|nr:MazG family protein [Oscillospiraceae bacterium]
MVNFENRNKYGVYDLQKLVSLLRSPDGCPWDREQTHGSIRRNLLEEAYEAAEAIDEGDPAHLCEELGDVLTQVVFHADIESDAGRFDLDGVADRVCRKLLLRHPHVFGDVTVENSDEVLRNWDDIKRAEKNQDTVSDSLDAVAKSLPALWRAEKLQKKAAKASPALNIPSDGSQDFGRELFELVNAARVCGVDPEEALHRYCDGFTERFRAIEQSGRELKNVPAEDFG